MKHKKILPILLMVWPYLIIPLFTDLFDGRTGTTYFTAYVLLTVPVYIGNIAFACSYRNARELVFWNMAVKLGHIPFYIAVFVVGFSVMIAIPLLFIMDAVLLLTSSAYGINGLLKLRKRGDISNGTAALHILLHLVFVADVVSAVIVYKNWIHSDNRQ